MTINNDNKTVSLQFSMAHERTEKTQPIWHGVRLWCTHCHVTATASSAPEIVFKKIDINYSNSGTLRSFCCQSCNPFVQLTQVILMSCHGVSFCGGKYNQSLNIMAQVANNVTLSTVQAQSGLFVWSPSGTVVRMRQVKYLCFLSVQLGSLLQKLSG